jgi:hypothetical protein
MSRQKRIILLTVVVWALVCAASEYLGISRFLHSNDPSDVYDKTWSFQLMVFAFFRLPIWLFGLAVLIGSELFFFRRRARNRKQTADSHAPVAS